MRDGSQQFAIVRNALGSEFADTLSEAELAAMGLVISRNGATAPDVADALGVTRRGAQKLLARLIERGLLERTGAARSTR